MTEPERLRNAPIVEAVLEIVAVLPSSVDLEKLAAFQDRLQKQYPSKQVRNQWSGRVEVRAEGPLVTQATGGPIGYQFASADAKQVVQARKNGFAFSRLHPYNDWEAFSSEARELWNLYLKHTGAETVRRLGLRYINRMELPLPITDLKEYVLTGPEIAPGLPQSLVGFFFRVIIPDERTESLIVITETTEEAASSRTTLPFILDIDVFREGGFPTNPDRLWPVFDGFHEAKNRVFFGSLTDKAKELFK